MVAILDHSHFLAHAPFANHAARSRSRHLDVAAGAISHIAENKLLSDATAHADGETIDQLGLAVGVFVFFGQPHGAA